MVLVYWGIVDLVVCLLVDVMSECGVMVYGDEESIWLDLRIVFVVFDEYDNEYLFLDFVLCIVDDLEEVVDYIVKYGLGYLEIIVIKLMFL